MNTKQAYDEHFTFVVVYDVLIKPGRSDMHDRAKAHRQVHDSVVTG